jgi:hypothetical protein
MSWQLVLLWLCAWYIAALLKKVFVALFEVVDIAMAARQY